MSGSEESDKSKHPFHWRGLTSFLVTLGFLLLAVTGTMLFFTPQGRVARWTDWQLAGLDKDQWASVHMLAAVLFIAAAAFHVYFNWEVFVRYIKTKAGFPLKREMAIAVALVAVIVAGTLWELPPFQYLVDANNRIKVHWDTRSAPAPYPHAEVSTLEDFARRTNVPLDNLQARLADLGLSAPDASLTVGEASLRLGLSPNALYERLGHSANAKGPGQSSAGRGGGSGWGRRSLQDVCSAQGIDLQEAIAALESAGIRSSGDKTLRAIADRAQCSSPEILSLIGAETSGAGRGEGRRKMP